MTERDCRLTAEESERDLSGVQLRELLESLLSEGTTCRLKVKGSSMTPFIRHGDVVEIVPAGPIARIGQVVAASDKDGGRVLVHRVARVRDAESGVDYLLCGDNRSGSEDWVPGHRVLGVVRAVWRDGARVFVGGKILGPIGVKIAGFIRRIRGRHSSNRR